MKHLTKADLRTLTEVKQHIEDIEKVFVDPSSELATLIMAWEKLNKVVGLRLAREL